MLRRPVSSEAIIGREGPLRVLDALLDEAAQGRPGIALLSGEAGVGKTRIAAAAEERARARGMLVLHGECMEFGGEEFPYAPVIAALRELPLDDPPPEIAGLLTGGAGAPPVASGRYGQGRLCERLLQQFACISHEREPLAIVLEDVHWADRSSRDLIEFLARSLRTERIAVLLTYRTGELDPDHPLRRLVAELGRKPVVRRLDLAPLDCADVARQLEAIAGGPVAARQVERIHALSGGNPFFVEELYATGTDDIPATLTELVARRVARLSAASRSVLTITAAAGGRVSHEVLASVAGDEQLGAAVREALDAGFLVREDADRGVALRHNLIGEVVYRDLVPYERERLHGALGSALAAAHAPAAQLAHQWHRAGAREQALAASLRAADEALSVYAFPEALAQLERALELGGGDRLELLASAAHAARYTGERERSIALARQALAELDHAAEPARAAQLYGKLGEYHYWDDAAALDCYERALTLLDPDPSPVRAQLLAAKGHALLGLRRLQEARTACEAALATGGDEAVARTTLGLVLGFLGEADAGEEQLRRVLALPITEHTPRAYVHLGELLRLRGDHAGAEAAMREGEAAAAGLGMRGTFGHFMFVNGAADLVRLGRWDEAQARLEAAERLELGLTTAALHGAVAGELYALRGETGRARSQLDAAIELAGQGIPSEFVAPIHGALATLATVEGDPGEARRQVAAALEALGEDRDPLYAPPLHALGVRAEADARAEPARADELLAELKRMPEWPQVLANAALARAERSRLAGASDATAWNTAKVHWDALGESHPAAYARLRAAEALLGAGDRADAEELLRTAHAAAAALGARPLQEEVESLARRARISLEPVPVPPAGEDELLTRREAEILELLADGLTNREIAERLFISQKTVGTHLGHIFAKLGVHNRVAAAGRARGSPAP